MRCICPSPFPISPPPLPPQPIPVQQSCKFQSSCSAPPLLSYNYLQSMASRRGLLQTFCWPGLARPACLAMYLRRVVLCVVFEKLFHEQLKTQKASTTPTTSYINLGKTPSAKSRGKLLATTATAALPLFAYPLGRPFPPRST